MSPVSDQRYSLSKLIHLFAVLLRDLPSCLSIVAAAAAAVVVVVVVTRRHAQVKTSSL